MSGKNEKAPSERMGLFCIRETNRPNTKQEIR